jgi:hypothetical protein
VTAAALTPREAGVAIGRRLKAQQSISPERAPAVMPREYGAARGRAMKAEPITPEKAAFLASRLMTGVPQKRDEGDAPAA